MPTYVESDEWSCVYRTRAERLAKPVWSSDSGRTLHRMQSLMMNCNADAYAFINEPLPPIIVMEEATVSEGTACIHQCMHACVYVDADIHVLDSQDTAQL